MSGLWEGGTDMPQLDTARQVAKNAPTPEEIRQRAYEIHIERGGIHGCDLDDWLQAEGELQQKQKIEKNSSNRK
jgi:hypothetical protein